jgi:7,8-dihydropterin-6-yl-methyl-4-(beta-D-ribofuranosyl)aminobenzene 5'-phosphate synthase
MKVSVLVENSVCKSNSKNLKSEHGLSIYIETEGSKILFDTGQSDLFIRNAEKMNIDLSGVDFLFISHGHFDHGGGLQHFLKINKKAKIYMQKNAFQKYYTRILGFIPYYVGLNQKVLFQNPDRFNFIGKDMFLDENIVLLVGFNENFPQPEANKSLFEKTNDKFLPDKFKHEIALLLIEKNEKVIFSSCSHSGIINILEKANTYFGEMRIKAVFGGFHIHNPINKKNENPEYIKKLTERILVIDSVFYTGHCTGEENFMTLREKMGNNIQTLNTGEIFNV